MPEPHRLFLRFVEEEGFEPSILRFERKLVTPRRLRVLSSAAVVVRDSCREGRHDGRTENSLLLEPHRTATTAPKSCQMEFYPNIHLLSSGDTVSVR